MKKYEIWKYNNTDYCIITRNGLFSKKLNLLLKRYEKGTQFNDEDGPVFRFHKKYKINVQAILGLNEWPFIE